MTLLVLPSAEVVTVISVLSALATVDNRRVLQSGGIDEISPEFACIDRRGKDKECENQGSFVF